MEEIVLQQLMPRFELRDRISALDVSAMVGVHVCTAIDQSPDDGPWDVGNGDDTRGLEKLKRWRARTRPESFFEELDRMITEEPGVRFFLCTDRPEHYDVFLSRYGKARIVRLADKRFGPGTEQAESALVELYLLSRTRLIVGSGFSAFTDVAARLGGRVARLAGQDF